MFTFMKNMFTLIFTVVTIIIFGFIGFLIPYALIGIFVIGTIYFLIKEKRIEDKINKSRIK